jgi:hypothetical protein
MSNESSCHCGQAHGACTTEFQYAVKVVCGEVFASQDNVPTPVAPGRYWTAINIHNPNKCQTARFRWKVAVAGVEPGIVSMYQRTPPLEPDRALEIDCPQIIRAATPPQQQAPRFVKGYVVIESDVELDVVAVYTSSPGACGPLSFHMERVQSRCVPVCEDLVLPLHTGLADWRTVSPTAGPVALVNPLGASWTTPPPFGSQWVSQTSNDGVSPSSALQRVYDLCFDLCYGYTVPARLDIQIKVDDTAQVSLNGNSLGPTVPFNTLTTLTVSAASLTTFLRAGRNCLRVVVANTGGGATGFALAGILQVLRGKCPCSPLPIATRSQGPAGFVAQDVESQAAS